ncbi:MAG: type II secretion system protein [Burkholderiaceae bacterium]
MRRSERHRRRPAGQGGFAYLWVMLLVVFMGLGLTVAVQIDSTLARRSQEQALLAVGHQFRLALERYHETQGTGVQREYPASLDDLLRDPRAPGIRRHLRKLFVDPVTGRAEWGLLRVSGRIVGVHSLSEAMPIKQDGFEAQDMSLRGKTKYSDWVFTYPPDLLLREPATGASAPAGNAAASAPFTPASAASNPFGSTFTFP